MNRWFFGYFFVSPLCAKRRKEWPGNEPQLHSCVCQLSCQLRRAYGRGDLASAAQGWRRWRESRAETENLQERPTEATRCHEFHGMRPKWIARVPKVPQVRDVGSWLGSRLTSVDLHPSGSRSVLQLGQTSSSCGRNQGVETPVSWASSVKYLANAVEIKASQVS